MLEAFIDDDAGLAELLSEVSDASRLRNGIQYFTGTPLDIAPGPGTRREAVVSWLREHGARPAAYISMA